jgi:hypothetical protein
MVNDPGDAMTGRLEQRSREIFDTSVDELDARTRSKLNQARQRAVAELQHPARPMMRRLLLPAGGLAVATAAIVVAVFSAGGDGAAGAVPLDDLDIVAGADNLEMIEDVEFYAWLAEQGGAAAADHSG